eukprot:1731814-Rhodomonas_salina.1
MLVRSEHASAVIGRGYREHRPIGTDGYGLSGRVGRERVVYLEVELAGLHFRGREGGDQDGVLVPAHDLQIGWGTCSPHSTRLEVTWHRTVPDSRSRGTAQYQTRGHEGTQPRGPPI